MHNDHTRPSRPNTHRRHVGSDSLKIKICKQSGSRQHARFKTSVVCRLIDNLQVASWNIHDESDTSRVTSRRLRRVDTDGGSFQTSLKNLTVTGSRDQVRSHSFPTDSQRSDTWIHGFPAGGWQSCPISGYGLDQFICMSVHITTTLSTMESRFASVIVDTEGIFSVSAQPHVIHVILMRARHELEPVRMSSLRTGRCSGYHLGFKISSQGTRIVAG